MIPYVFPPNDSKHMDNVLSGSIRQIEGVWYWTEWHVSYAQQSMNTSKNFVTREQADQNWEKRLADLRQAWGHKGKKFSETCSERPNGGKSIRFRSILKNGKPGKLTGILYMDRIVKTPIST